MEHKAVSLTTFPLQGKGGAPPLDQLLRHLRCFRYLISYQHVTIQIISNMFTWRQAFSFPSAICRACPIDYPPYTDGKIRRWIEASDGAQRKFRQRFDGQITRFCARNQSSDYVGMPHTILCTASQPHKKLVGSIINAQSLLFGYLNFTSWHKMGTYTFITRKSFDRSSPDSRYAI